VGGVFFVKKSLQKDVGQAKSKTATDIGFPDVQEMQEVAGVGRRRVE